VLKVRRVHWLMDAEIADVYGNWRANNVALYLMDRR
jgi:hypothetical protein